MIRRLADLGPDLIPLLHRLDVSGDTLAHVAAVLAAIEPATDPDTTTERSAATAQTVLMVAGEAALTPREFDVLRLLAAPKDQQGDRPGALHRTGDGEEEHGAAVRQAQRPRTPRGGRQSSSPGLPARLTGPRSRRARRCCPATTTSGAVSSMRLGEDRRSFAPRFRCRRSQIEPPCRLRWSEGRGFGLARRPARLR